MGAVGHYAVQFARRLAARQVLASVSQADKARLAQQARADVVLNYRDAPITQQVRAATGGAGVDRIIEVDIAANAAADLDMLCPGGQLVVYGSGAPAVQLPFFPLIVGNVTLAFFIVYNLSPADRQHAQSVLDGWLQRGVLQHNISRRLPLAEIAAAHQLVEQGRLAGNLVLSLPWSRTGASTSLAGAMRHGHEVGPAAKWSGLFDRQRAHVSPMPPAKCCLHLPDSACSSGG